LEGYPIAIASAAMGGIPALGIMVILEGE
jgi:hypothetical protein